MRFWDSSALVPLLAAERCSAVSERMLGEDGELVVWWGSRIECLSAVARKCRAGEAADEDVEVALRRLNEIETYASIVEPEAGVRESAELLIRRHPLGAAEALQLAAALAWSRGRPTGMDFVCLDARLGSAARKEGFTVHPSRLPSLA